VAGSGEDLEKLFFEITEGVKEKENKVSV